MTHYAEVYTYTPTLCRCGTVFTPRAGKRFHLWICVACVEKYELQAKRVNAADSPRVAKREIPVTRGTRS